MTLFFSEADVRSLLDMEAATRLMRDAFVELGDQIAPGQVLCIVEAMKLMNEIEAEIDGKIVEILVENGKPVEYGDRLFRIETA